MTAYTLSRTIARWLGSEKFFYFVLGLLAFQALWIALSGVYPMAFDEDFHLGIIQIYAHHVSPFLTTQPDHASQFGAVARDPSYLYHYVMSFLFRPLAHLNQATQVIILRLINIGLFVGGVVLFRHVMCRLRVSKALVHFSLLIFVLIPIVPFLAAQINYDNLLFPLVALALLLTMQISSLLQTTEDIPLQKIGLLLIVFLLGSLVKYAFFPIIAGIVVYLAVIALQRFWRRGGEIWPTLRRSFGKLSRRAVILLSIGLVLSGGLFVQRYGYNALKYKTPIPKCGAVLTIEECQAYGPWNRNTMLAKTKDPSKVKHLPAFVVQEWLYGLWVRSFFAVDGPVGDYATRMPLPVPAKTVAVLATLSAVLIAVQLRKLLKGDDASRLALGVITFYCVALLLQLYSSYRYTGQPVAINGRYLMLVLPLIILLSARAFSLALRQWPKYKPWLAAVLVVLMLQGGGVLTFIVRSDRGWDWPNPVVQNVNDGTRSVVWPLIPFKEWR